MQYGGNTVPYIKGEKALESYCSQLETQIKYLRQVSPQSKILFIGPSDMSTKIDGRMETYPFLPRIVDALRDMCLHNEVAYWDLYKAMGGKNSMASWVNASPQLAGADYVHFTRMGADRAGAMLYQGMMLAYDYYTYRRGSHQDTDTVAIAQPIEVYIPQDSTIFQVLERDTIVNIISKDTIVAD